MKEFKYTVFDKKNVIIAAGMELDTALLLVEGLYHKYNMQPGLVFSIIRVEDTTDGV